jgi:DNA polymerase III subunit beta
MEPVALPVRKKVHTKFSLNVKKIKLPFESLFKTINYSTVLPILEDVLVVKKKGELSFTSTDLENITTITIPDSSEKDFAFICPGIELKYLIKNSLADTLEFSLNGYDYAPELTVSNGVFKLKLQCPKVEDYPKIVSVANPIRFTIDVKEIIPYLEKALAYVSGDSLRPAMTGVCFRDIAGMLHVAATDAHRLYWYPICKTPAKHENCSFIVSRKAVQLIVQTFRTEAHITLDLSDPHLYVWCEGKAITTRLIDARYPDFVTIIPKNIPLSFSIHRSNLAALLRMSAPFTNKSTQQLTISVFPDRLDITGGDVDFSMDFNYSIPVVGPSLDTFNPFVFGINANFLLQALDCSKTEYLKIESSMIPTKALVVDECVLLMPLMLNA